jgi:hypothetical protein
MVVGYKVPKLPYTRQFLSKELLSQSSYCDLVDRLRTEAIENDHKFVQLISVAIPLASNVSAFIQNSLYRTFGLFGH